MTIRWSWEFSYEQLNDLSHLRADIALLEAIERNLGKWDTSPSSPFSEPSKPSVSRNQLKALIESGAVLVNGAQIKANTKIKDQSLVEIHFPPLRKLDLKAEEKPIEILFEDEHLVIVNKPPGLTVHPSETQTEGTLVNRLLHHIQNLSGIGGVLRPGIVHRIDKDTSGALVITKSDLAHQKLSEVFALHQIQRTYWAICYGSPTEGSLFHKTKIEGSIGRNPQDRKKMAIVNSGGKPAVTYYQKKMEFGLPNKKPFSSWLEVTLETGRTHQVRVHLTSIGHSLLGDPVYGTPSEKQPKWVALPKNIQDSVKKLPGQALHARVLGFIHPVTGKELYFEATPPPDFQNLLDLLTLLR